MTLFRTALILSLAPAALLLAQTPAPKPAPPAPAFTPAVSADKVVLSVGEMSLTAAQFNQLIEMLPEQSRAQARGAGRREFANEVARVLALAEEGKRRKLDEDLGYRTQSQFQAENLLAGRAYAEIGKPDDAELHQYYEAHKTEFEQVRARHILIRAAGSPVPAGGKKELSDQEALAKAQEIRKKIVDGADFAALAAQESDDDQTKGKGGELSFFHRGQMVPPFEDAAFKMNVGDLSEPVKSPLGYHLIQVEAKNPGTFEEAKPDIERRLRPQKAQAALEDLVKKSIVVLDPDFFGPAPK